MKIACLFVFVIFGWQINARNIAGEAQSAYLSKNYETSIRLWSELLKNNESSNFASIHAHIGDAYSKLQNYSAAICSYEKSLLDDYNQADVKFNIKVCRAKLNLDTENKTLFTNDWAHKISYAIHSAHLKWMIILLGWILMLLIGFNYFKPNGWIKKITPYGFGVAFLLSFLLTLQLYFRSDNGKGIIASNITGFENASLKGKSKPIREGEKIEVVDEIGQTIRVKTESDELFWIDKTAIYHI